MSRAIEAYLAQCIEDKTDYEIGTCAWKEFEQSDEKLTLLRMSLQRLVYES